MSASFDPEWEHATSEQVCDLTDAVLTLTEQVRLLRLAVDEIGADLGWAIRTRVLDRLPPPSATRITSLPLDPLADDFYEQVNALTAADLPADEPAPQAPPPPRRQSSLW